MTTKILEVSLFALACLHLLASWRFLSNLWDSVYISSVRFWFRILPVTAHWKMSIICWTHIHQSRALVLLSFISSWSLLWYFTLYFCFFLIECLPVVMLHVYDVIDLFTSSCMCSSSKLLSVFNVLDVDKWTVWAWKGTFCLRLRLLLLEAWWGVGSRQIPLGFGKFPLGLGKFDLTVGNFHLVWGKFHWAFGKFLLLGNL